MGIVRYAAALLRSSCKDGRILIALIVALLFATAPAIPQSSQLAFAGEDRTYYQELYTESQSDLEHGLYDSAPEALQTNMEREAEALEKAVTASDDHAYYAGLAEYTNLLIDDYDTGYLSGTDRPSLEAEAALYQALSTSSEPELYASSADMPALCYVSFTFAQAPSIVWLALPLLICWSLLSRTERPRLLGCVPIRTGQKTLALIVLSLIQSIVLLVIAFVPSFVVQAVAHGVGSLDYPVVIMQNGAVLSLTVGETLARQLAQFAVGCLFVSLLVQAVKALTSSTAAALAIALMVCVIPLAPGYYDAPAGYTLAQAQATGTLRDLVAYLPTTYLSFAPIAGYPGSFPAVDILPIAHASFAMGMLVLLVWSGACTIVLVAARLIQKKLGVLRRGAVSHA